MQRVSQLGTFRRGGRDEERCGTTKLQINSLTGTRTIVTAKKPSSHIPVPTSLQEEEAQLQQALEASLGSTATHALMDQTYADESGDTPLLRSAQRPHPPAEAFGYFC